MEDSVLVTGGTGKTGREVVAQLRRSGANALAASRQPSSGNVEFDWARSSTWEPALATCGSVYLVAPSDNPDPAPVMIDFIEAAAELGVRRFVLLSASLLPAGGPAMGQVHQWLLGAAVEWAVLRPSWFMENFSEGQHQGTIVADRSIYSATQSGRVGFISAADIAATAVEVLSASEAPNTDYILTGPAALSYSDVAQVLSRHLGQPISHASEAVTAVAARLVATGVPLDTATMVAGMDDLIASGQEARTTDCVELLTGRAPSAFEDFVQEHLGAWS